MRDRGELTHVQEHPHLRATGRPHAPRPRRDCRPGRHRHGTDRGPAARPGRSATADPVHYWNDVLLEIVRREGGDILDLTIVNRMVTQMRNDRDGSENPRVYVGDDKPGAWRPTSYPDMNDPGCARHSQAVTPFWGEMKPFALASGSQFRPPHSGPVRHVREAPCRRRVQAAGRSGPVGRRRQAHRPHPRRQPDTGPGGGRLVLGQRRGRHLQAARPAPAGHPRHRHRTQAEHLRQRTAVRPRVDRHGGRRHRRQGREVPDSGRPVAARLRHPRRWPRPGMEAPPQEPGRNQFQPLLPGLGLRTRHLRRCLGRGYEALLQQ
ncbi:hypothetical protein JOF58_000838 [Streptomyces cinnamonensis]|nr:hypothetical protein [Streptomyces virginiae]